MASFYDAVGCRRFGGHGPNLLAPSSFFQVSPARVTPLVGVCLELQPVTRFALYGGRLLLSPVNHRMRHAQPMRKRSAERLMADHRSAECRELTAVVQL